MQVFIFNLHGMQIPHIAKFYRLSTSYGMQTNRSQYFTDEGHVFYINGMQRNRLQNFTEEGHLFYIKGMQANRCRNFTDEEHHFYIQLPWYANKRVAIFCRLSTSYINSMQANRCEILQIKNIFFTLMVCKQAYVEILQMKGTFFIFNFHGMPINM